jgi:hypothetical protein
MTVEEAIVEMRATVRDQALKLGNLKSGTGNDLVAGFNAYQTAFGRGLAVYSQLKPRKLSQTVFCGANGRVPTSSITEFDEGFVDLMRIEYPIIPLGEPNWLEDSDWQLDLDGSVQVIRFTQIIPGEGQQVRIVHLVPHKAPLDFTGACTVVDSDMPAVVNWSAAECLQMLADEYAQASEHTVASADIATFVNKSGIYSSRAVEMKKQFFLHLRAGRYRARQQMDVVRG